MARIPKLDSAGRFLAADVNAQIDARTKATMRADLPALAKELKIGGVDGSVPIFPTLAEAQAWEAKNPGKKALTLEGVAPTPSDPTPVTPGTVIASDDFTGAQAFLADASSSKRSTPVGALPWKRADATMIDMAGIGGGFAGDPLMSTGRFVNGAGYITLPTQNVAVEFDYAAAPLAPGTSTGLALGGRMFVAATSNSTFRVLTYNATNSTWGATVNALGIAYKETGKIKLTYDGATYTVFLDGVQVYQAVYALQHNHLAIRTNGAQVGSGGDVISISGNRWIDNLKVTYHA